jgi:hypothetical protein
VRRDGEERNREKTRGGDLMRKRERVTRDEKEKDNEER